MKTRLSLKVLFTTFALNVFCVLLEPAVAPVVPRRRTIYRNTNLSGSGHLGKEGALRLVGGQSKEEGNVEIYHAGRWGSICDDEWDINEAQVACQALGFDGALRATTDGQYGRARKIIYMDNLYCTGNETELFLCPFDGWLKHDCNTNEAAGVVCRSQKQTADDEQPQAPSQMHLADAASSPSSAAHANQVMAAARTDLQSFQPFNDVPEVVAFPRRYKQIRLANGRNDHEGRVEVELEKDMGWGVVCGDGWSLWEATVVCKELGLGYAQHAIQSSFFGHNSSLALLGDINCRGGERSLAECASAHRDVGPVTCPGRKENIAGVICAAELPDLVPDEKEVESSAYLEDRQMLLLQCAAEENCLASGSGSYASPDRNDYNWFYETRRLLRFTARITNVGTADFKPFAPKLAWQWHACHRHFHSMEVFAHFDILDAKGVRVAEGHKASFCLEDNDCQEGVEGKFKCANYGDQGISVGCTDTYLHSIDCQWIDITDVVPGMYQLKISINPEMKIAELSFDNNAVLCALYYTPQSAHVFNCTLTRP